MQAANTELQHRLKQAEAGTAEAQRAAAREAARAAELQVRCLAAESHGSELLNDLEAAHRAAAGLQERLDAAAAAAVGEAERRAVHGALIAMLNGCARRVASLASYAVHPVSHRALQPSIREMGRARVRRLRCFHDVIEERTCASALCAARRESCPLEQCQVIGPLLRFSDSEQEQLAAVAAKPRWRGGGLLRRFTQIPGRMLQPDAAASPRAGILGPDGKVSIASSWTKFLTDEPDADSADDHARAPAQPLSAAAGLSASHETLAT